MTVTFVDAVGATREWINSRTDRLVGVGKPLQKGAHLRPLDGASDTCWAWLTLSPGTGMGPGAESAAMAARVSAQVYGPTLEAVTYASVALADEVATYLSGRWTDLTGSGVRLWVGGDVTGPTDLPDNGLPRHLVDFTVILQPTLPG